MTSRPWALESGLPSAHIVRAALRAATLIDGHGSPVGMARTTYSLHPSDALYLPEDLRLGERLLRDCDLLAETDGHLHLTPPLAEAVSLSEDEGVSLVLERAVMAGSVEAPDGPAGELPADVLALAAEVIPDAERREAFLLALARKHDESQHAELGLRGEEFVVALAREQLVELGLPDLAAGVQRLSELPDDLGYDIVAPRLGGKRRLEVKTAGRSAGRLFRFFISRNEIDWGLRDPDWAIVACRLDRDGEVGLVGWCRAQALEVYLPADSGGSRWRQTETHVPFTLFEEGLPPAA